MSAWRRFESPVVFGLVALAMAPLALLYFRNLWSQPHYQFFPVLIAAVGVLLVSRWKVQHVEVAAAPVDEDEPYEQVVKKPSIFWSKVRPLVALAIVGLGIAIEFAAIWAFPNVTPWGGYVGLLVAGFGAVMYVGADRPMSLVPAWALMLMILLPPENADDQLITYLQHRTASYTSQVLDFLGVDHIREGVMIEIASKKLFVEEACSGVQSLFSLLAVAAVLAVWYQRSIVHTIFLFVAAVAGAAAINVFRTVAIVYGLDKVGIDLLAEPQHAILGIVVFLLALGWLVCCDAFLTFLIRPIDVPDTQMLENVWIRLFNRLISGFRWESEQPPPAGRGPLLTFLCHAALVMIAVSSGVLALASTKAVIASQRPGSNPLMAPRDEGKVFGTLEAVTEDFLPPEFDGWNREKFEVVRRLETNALGEHSKTWLYSTPFGLATLSIDYPFTGWHDLKTCYRGAGWNASEITTSETNGGHGVYDVTQFTLRKPSGEMGLVVFATLNEALRPMPSREGSGGTTQTFVDKIRKAVSVTDNMDLVAQYQILVQPGRRLTDNDMEDIHQHLNKLKDRLTEYLQPAVEAAR